jgi:TPR repeat protein
VEKDYVEAVAWFLKAAEQKFAPAQFKLGICFENGQGVEKNSVEAMRWFHEAAELNDGDAQGILGDRYAAGKGVERNFEKAYAWYNLAAVTSKEAATSRDALEKRMSPQQIAEAQKRTRELRAEIDARLKGK